MCFTHSPYAQAPRAARVGVEPIRIKTPRVTMPPVRYHTTQPSRRAVLQDTKPIRRQKQAIVGARNAQRIVAYVAATPAAPCCPAQAGPASRASACGDVTPAYWRLNGGF